MENNEVKLECLRIAERVAGGTAEGMLELAKKLYEWVLQK